MTRELILSNWRKCQINPAKRFIITEIANTAMAYRDRYEKVATTQKMPWYMIAAAHMRESDFNFNTYLGNGDALFNHLGNPVRTVHVPRGRGPFTNWEEGAEDTMSLNSWSTLPARSTHWDIVTVLAKMEELNGMGYSRMGIPSPYVWSMTNVQVAGKYVSDGVFDPNLWDVQPGCAALLLELRDKHGIDLNEQ